MDSLIASFFAGPVAPPVGPGFAAPAIAAGLFGLSLDRLAAPAMPVSAGSMPIAFAGALAPVLLPEIALAAPMVAAAEAPMAMPPAGDTASVGIDAPPPVAMPLEVVGAPRSVGDRSPPPVDAPPRAADVGEPEVAAVTVRAGSPEPEPIAAAAPAAAVPLPVVVPRGMGERPPVRPADVPPSSRAPLAADVADPDAPVVAARAYAESTAPTASAPRDAASGRPGGGRPARVLPAPADVAPPPPGCAPALTDDRVEVDPPAVARSASEAADTPPDGAGPVPASVMVGLPMASGDQPAAPPAPPAVGPVVGRARSGTARAASSVPVEPPVPATDAAPAPAASSQVAAEPAPVRPARHRTAAAVPVPDDPAPLPDTASPAIGAAAAIVAPPPGDDRPTVSQREPAPARSTGSDPVALREAAVALPAADTAKGMAAEMGANRGTAPAPDAPMPSPADAAGATFASAVTASAAAQGPAVSSPAPTPAAEPAPVAAVPGRIGHETGVAIARHVAVGGGETIAIRLDPAEMGRVEVRLSFDDRGTLQAVVAADNPASLDLLRRESPELVRALADAGVPADGGSFRFDARSGGGSSGGQGGQRPSPPLHAGASDPALPDETRVTAAYRPIRTRGRVDLMA